MTQEDPFQKKMPSALNRSRELEPTRSAMKRSPLEPDQVTNSCCRHLDRCENWLRAIDWETQSRTQHNGKPAATDATGLAGLP